jgi:hypothetical protein
MGLRLTCMSAGLLLALAITAQAAPLDDARTAVDSSDYIAARTALEKALAAGGASPEDVAAIYKLSGIVEGALGNTEAATAAFARWLELDPKGTLPVGTSPKIERPFKSAAAHTKPIAAKADTTADPPSVTLVVASDPQQLIVHAHVIVVVDGGAPTEIDGKPGVKIVLPRGQRLDLQVQALDEHDNRVFELGTKAVPLVITGAGAHVAKQGPTKTGPQPHEPARPRRWYFQWYVWGGVAVASAAVSGVFAYETKQNVDQWNQLSRNSLDHVYGDAHSVETAARRDLLIADIAAGTAGAFALGAVVLYLTRPHLEQLPVAAVPTRDGGMFVLGGHF